METPFDLDRFLQRSRKVEISDLDVWRAKEHGLTKDEIRCLTYMMDIESHTNVYLRGLLRTCLINDPEVVAFLTCWAYEEYFHGRALLRFMEATGVQFDRHRPDEVRRQRSVRERAEELASSALCRILIEYQAVYLVWGAIQELSTLEGYGILAARTEHPVLKELLGRIIKDERRHFSFYFNKAFLHLRPTTAQFLTTMILRLFWTPVGEGLKPNKEVSWITQYLFGGRDGLQAARRIDKTIARLPGLEWFNLFSHRRQESIQRFLTSESA